MPLLDPVKAIRYPAMSDTGICHKEGVTMGTTSGPSKTARQMGRPTNSDSAETRRMLVAAAAAELASVGFERMNLESVAAAAGITRGAIYRYYDSKRELARAAVAESTVTGWAESVAEHVMPAAGIVEQLRALVRVTVNVTLHDPNPSIGYYEMSRMGEHDEAIAAIFRSRSQGLRRMITGLIRDAKERGELVADADVRSIVDSVSGLIWAVGAGASTAPNDAVRQQILMCSDLLLDRPSWLAT